MGEDRTAPAPAQTGTKRSGCPPTGPHPSIFKTPSGSDNEIPYSEIWTRRAAPVADGTPNQSKSGERADLPQVPCRLDWFLQRPDDFLTCHREFPVLMYPSFQVLAQRLPSDGESVSVNQFVLE